ncbi:MAG: UrcA family protein [Novosphingobium sp.]
MKKLIISGFAAACLLTGATAAHAEKETIHVTYSDLDLTRKSDIDALYKRVRAAVKTACETPRSVLTYAVDGLCVKEAMAEAKAQIQEHRTLALAMASETSR